MTSGERQGPALEIVQTRDLTRGEAKRMSHFASHALFRAARGDPLYWIFKLVGLGGVVVGCAMLTAFLMSDASAVIPTWSLLSLLIGYAAYHAMTSRARRTIIRANHELHRAGTRYRLTNGGLEIDWENISAHFAWRSMQALADYKPSFLICIGLVQVAVLPKAACENQNVEAFCAELTRRWQAQRRHAGVPA